MGWIVLVVLLVCVGIGLSVRKSNKEFDQIVKHEKEEIQREIDLFIEACGNNGISVSPINFTTATNEVRNAWLQKTTPIVMDLYKKIEKDFVTKHNLVSECLLSGSFAFGLCSVSKTHFFYKIDFCPGKSYGESLYFHLCPDVTIIETDTISHRFQVEYGFRQTESAGYYFAVLASFVNNGYNVSYKSIPLDDIIHFRVEGQVEHVPIVSGSGGGVNIKGAVEGGMYLGTTGAIIGSQVGTETNIQTQIVEKDNRKIVLTYYQNGHMKTKTFGSDNPHSTIHVLRQLIPQKEQVVGNTSPMSQSSTRNTAQKKETEDEPNKLSQIKELKELLDLGAITQEEYDLKKKELLGL